MKQAPEPQGFALIVAVFMMVGFGLLGSLLAEIHASSSRGRFQQLDLEKAKLLADAGVRWYFENRIARTGGGQDPIFHFKDFINPGQEDSPTDVPMGTRSVAFGEGNIWVQKMEPPFDPIDDPRRKILYAKVMAKVREAVHHSEVRLEVKRDIPLQKALYAVGNVDLRGARDFGPPSPGITGSLQSEGTIQLPASGLTITGRVKENGLYRYPGYVATFLDPPYPLPDLCKQVSCPDPSEPLCSGAEVVFTAGTYGGTGIAGQSDAGYLWYIGNASQVVLQGPGTITINGAIKVAENPGAPIPIITRGDPNVIWKTFPVVVKNPNDSLVPAFVADSVQFTDDPGEGAPSIELTGFAYNPGNPVGTVAISRGDFKVDPNVTLKVRGVLLVGQDVDMGDPPVNLTLIYDPYWSDPNFTDPSGNFLPWFRRWDYEYTEWEDYIYPELP